MPAPRRPRTAAQRRRRAANRNPLYNPAVQLGGNQLRKAAKQITRAEFAPQRAALSREAANVRTQGSALQGRASDYYLQLAQQEQGNLDKIAGFNQALQSSVGASGEAARNAITEQLDASAARQEQATNVAGVKIPLPQLAAEGQAAQNRSALYQQDAQSAGAASAGAFGGLAQVGREARALQGGETQRQLATMIGNQMADVRGRRADLEAQVGPKRVQNLLGLRQQGYENLVTQAGLDIKTADLQSGIAQSRAERELARRKIRQTERNNRRRARLDAQRIAATRRGQDVTARGQDVNARQRALDRASRETIAQQRIRYGARAGGGLSTETKKGRTGITNAQTDIEQMLRSRTVPAELRAALKGTGLNKRSMNIDTARRVVVALGAPPLVAQAAAELAKYRAVRPSTRARLRQAGIAVPREWLGPVRVPNRPGVTL